MEKIKYKRKYLGRTYLYPLDLYASAAAHIMCAPADLPAPCEIKPGMIATFRILPVMMNVRAAPAGNCAKPATACCAAT